MNRTLVTRRNVLALFALAVLAPFAHAAQANFSEKDLVRLSTHVVTGTVIEVTEKEKAVNSAHRKNGVDLHTVFEVLVDTVDKGEGPRSGKVLYCRAWRVKVLTTETDPRKRQAGGDGAHCQPKVDDHVRLYLCQDELGEYRVLTPNGYQILKN